MTCQCKPLPLDGTALGEGVVFLCEIVRALVLVVDHDSHAVCVDVHAVDGPHEIRTGIVHVHGVLACPAKAELEVTRLKALEAVLLIIHHGQKTRAQAIERKCLGLVVRDKRLSGERVGPLALVAQVVVEFG